MSLMELISLSHLLLFNFILGIELVIGDTNTVSVCNDNDGSCMNECKDYDTSCPSWAANGECINNSELMSTKCRKSCQLCDMNLNENDECVDLHSFCADWALEGECLLNPEYMEPACPYSCYLCLNEPLRRQLGLDEYQMYDYLFNNFPIEPHYYIILIVLIDFCFPFPFVFISKRIKIFGSLNLGKLQLSSYTNNNMKEIDKDNEIMSTTKRIIKEMDFYSKTVLPDLIMTEQLLSVDNCKNTDELCAYWTSENQCNTNVTFMLEHCPLACQSCQLIDQFQRCYMASTATTNNNVRNINQLFQTIIDNHNQQQKRQSSLEILSKPKAFVDDNVSTNHYDNEEDDPWLLKISNFVTDKEVKALLSLADSSGWEEEKNAEDEPNSSIYPVWVNNKSNMDNTVLWSILERVSKLVDIPLEHFEHVEMLHYSNLGDSMTVHHDYMIHDAWKPAGPRILTAFLVLSDVTKGGATGFPELDWLTVPAKKGQLLLWPNIHDDQTMEPKLVHEGLPVIEGTKYAFNIWIHSNNWKKALEENCS